MLKLPIAMKVATSRIRIRIMVDPTTAMVTVPIISASWASSMYSNGACRISVKHKIVEEINS